MDSVAQTETQELLSAVRMLAAAFPRASWKADSEAVYVMAIAAEDVGAACLRQAVMVLVREEHELPPIALVLETCQRVFAGTYVPQWRCPDCGSDKIAGTKDGIICFDCDFEGKP